MVAVKVGYVFNVFNKKDLLGIKLKKTSTRVKVDEVEYVLYAGASYEDSRKIDRLLDVYGERKVDAFIFPKKEAR